MTNEELENLALGMMKNAEDFAGLTESRGCPIEMRGYVLRAYIAGYMAAPMDLRALEKAKP